MPSTEEAKEQAILPPDAFQYLNSIKLLQPELLDFWKYRDSMNHAHIPPPGHRVMLYKAKLEREEMLSRIKSAYAGLPLYREGCFKELLQWLHRFDFTQDEETFFDESLTSIIPAS